MDKCRHYTKSAMLILSSFAIPVVFAETQNVTVLDVEAITKKWKCNYCPDLTEKKWEGYFDLGLGFVSNDSYKIGEYSGLKEKGFYFNGDINALYRDDQGNYSNIQGENLGLDSAYLKIEQGRQGRFKLELEVDKISRYQLDTSRTPYSGGATQTLDASWVNAAATTGLTNLYNDLSDVNIFTRRRHFKLGGEYFVTERWSYEVWFKRQTKQGNQTSAFSFGSDRSAIFAKPIDYVTDEVELKANYNYVNFNGQIALNYSNFKNENKSFRWDNAYDAPTGVSQGQAGTPPGNSKQQIRFVGLYQGIKKVKLSGLLSYAQLKQNETFLPYTTNNNLSPPLLPQNALNGKVKLFSTNLAAHWQYSPQQTGRLIYEHHEQNNETTRGTFTYVTTDKSITSTPRANFPYSFRNRKLKMSTEYKFANKIKLSGGGQLALFDRTYQSVERTKEGSLWAKLKQQLKNSLQYSVKTEYQKRKIDNYIVVTELTPTDNPLMRKFNMSNRTGYQVKFNLNYSFTDALLFNFSGDAAKYNYDATTIGLTDSDEFSVGVDIQYMVSTDLSLSGLIQNTHIQSKQAGSQSFSTPNWYANNNDNILTTALGINYRVLEDKLSVGADYVHANSRSTVDISIGDAFPALTTNRDSLVLYADYNLDEKLSLKASYQYEQYNEDNWYIDDVLPNTLSNVLTLGEIAPSYNIGVFWLSLRYNF